MAADWDNSSYDADTDTVKISDTSTSSAAADTYEADPDAENYAAGNDPETAYQNQGRPDSPNGLSSYDGDNSDDAWDSQGDYPDTTDENAEADEISHDDQATNWWGDTDPDAANYADIDSPDTLADGQDSTHKTTANAVEEADTSQQDQDQHAEEIPERALPPEQRLSALEAENADARQQIIDANQKIADLEAKNTEQATQLDEQSARLDRIEQFLAGSEGNPNEESSEDNTTDKPGSRIDQQEKQDAVPGKHHATMAERQNTDEGTATKDARNHGWRRVTSSESLGLIGTFGGAAQALGDFAAHATPDGTIGLGLTAIGVAQILRARAEKKAERNEKR